MFRMIFVIYFHSKLTAALFAVSIRLTERGLLKKIGKANREQTSG